MVHILIRRKYWKVALVKALGVVMTAAANKLNAPKKE